MTFDELRRRLNEWGYSELSNGRVEHLRLADGFCREWAELFAHAWRTDSPELLQQAGESAYLAESHFMVASGGGL